MTKETKAILLLYLAVSLGTLCCFFFLRNLHPERMSKHLDEDGILRYNGPYHVSNVEYLPSASHLSKNGRTVLHLKPDDSTLILQGLLEVPCTDCLLLSRGDPEAPLRLERMFDGEQSD